MMNIYGVYDYKENEQCVCVGTVYDVANFFGISVQTVYEYTSKKIKRECRYMIEIVGRKDDIL